MAQTSNINSIDQNNPENSDITQLKTDNDGQINLPEGLFIGDTALSRDGQDLVLEFSEGESFAVENYFSDQNDILIQDSSGSALTEDLANSFIQSSPEYAQNSSMTDESPVGAVEEVKGSATVTHTDGSTEDLTLGTPIYQGDVIQTSGDGAVNIVFVDETSMAISEGARIAVDNYQFDAATESGTTDLSVLRGVFVYTSGLIGRDDPDDVEINTPVGSIGIRGTIIAGHINPEGHSEISVLEGAIVIKNGAGERTLSQQYETVKLSGFQEAIDYQGVEAANDIGKTYGSVSDVLPKLFSSINDAAKEEAQLQETDQETEEKLDASEENAEEQKAEEQEGETDPTLEMMEENVEFAPVEAIKFGKEHADKADFKKHKPHHKGKGGFHHKSEINDLLYQQDHEDDSPHVNLYIKHLFEGSGTGELISFITVKNYPPGTTVDFSASVAGISASSNYQITQVGVNKFKITLLGTAPVVGTLLATLEDALVLKLGASVISTIDTTHIPTVLDAAVNLDGQQSLNYNVDIGTAPTNIKVADFDGDGLGDYVFINGTGRVIADGTNTTSGDGYFYNSVDVLGDINNDGYADVIAGTETTSPGGKVAIIEGASTPAGISVSYKNFSSSVGDFLGHSVAGAGDFNAGSKSDYVISAPGTSGGAGRVIVQYGPSVDNLIIDGQGTEGLGKTVHGIGDINGDGISDIMATTAINTAYVIFGAIDSTSRPDIDTSEFNTNATSNGFKINAGGTLVAAGSAGDINGDGFDDFAVSLQNGSDVDTYIAYGNGTPTNMNLAYLENPDHALKIHHEGADGANYTVTALGDIDGDGFDDIKVSDGTEHFVVHGDIGGLAPYAMDGTATDGSGTASDPDGLLSPLDSSVKSLVGDVDFIDNGETNLRMTGGGSDNTFQINANQARIDGGEGFDTIKFMAGSGSLDFTTLNFEQIQQIEAIEFGNVSQMITLTAENIFNMLKSSDTGELHIKGTGTLNLDDLDGSSGVTIEQKIMEVLDEGGDGSASDLGAGHYQIGGYDLYIDPTVTVNIV